ncbi:unnamed protein product [Rotaria sp. Silwood1]|nr:unnamed protein product [Rotaria sp. Silwood1]
MGKSKDMIIFYNDSQSDNDSLQLIDPVNNLSLEHVEKTNSCQDLDHQSKKLEKVHLNDSNKTKEKSILKLTKKTHKYRHHPYININKSKTKTENRKQYQTNINYNIKYLKSLGYIEYSSSSSKEIKYVNKSNDLDKIQSLYIKVNNAIQHTF